MSSTPAENVPVLVIEDEPSVMTFVCRALERGGYRVQGAKTGEEALAMLANAQFRGVISDIRTPGKVDGAGVYHWLATNDPTLCQHVLFITGDIVNAGTLAVLQETGAPCIEKPFRIQDLLLAVEKTIGKAN